MSVTLRSSEVRYTAALASISASFAAHADQCDEGCLRIASEGPKEFGVGIVDFSGLLPECTKTGPELLGLARAEGSLQGKLRPEGLRQRLALSDRPLGRGDGSHGDPVRVDWRRRWPTSTQDEGASLQEEKSRDEAQECQGHQHGNPRRESSSPEGVNQRSRALGPDLGLFRSRLPERPVPGARMLAANHLVCNESEGVDIGPRSKLAARELLGGHVLRGAGGIRQCSTWPRHRRPCNAEVHDHCSEPVSAADKHHVAGLEVTVNQPLGMDRAQPGRQLLQHRDGLGHAEGTGSGEVLRKCLAFEIFHADEGKPLALEVLMQLVDSTDVWMGNPSGRQDFAPEPVHGHRIGDECRADGFHCDVGLEHEVARLVDLAHSPSPEEAQQLESPGERLPNQNPFSRSGRGARIARARCRAKRHGLLPQLASGHCNPLDRPTLASARRHWCSRTPAT